MLIPKIISTFLTIVLSIISFSTIYFVLQKLPKAEIVIAYLLKIEKPFSVHLCQNFILSSELKEKIIEIIEAKNLTFNINFIHDKVLDFFKNVDFEIILNNISIKRGKADVEEIYTCYFFYKNKIYEIIIKV